MKKKLLLFFITLLVLFVGRNVYAYELKCPSGPFNYGDYFDCYLLGSVDSYDVLSGTLDKDNYLNCDFDTTKIDGLDIVEDPSKTFSVKGNAYSTTLVTISCLVTKKLDNNATTSLTIEDFKYATTKGDRDEIILHSKDININKYVDASQNKSRDTSYDGSLIKKLSIKDVTLPGAGFSKYVTVYNLKVPYEIDSLDFDVELVDDNASMEITGDTKELRVGETTIIDILVTSADNNHQTCYTFEVTRYAEGEEIYYAEDDATLQNITIDGYNLGFESRVEKYDLHVKSDVSVLKVTAKPTVDGAHVKISGTNNIEDGSIIGIEVSSKNYLNTKMYTITVHKEKKKTIANATYIVIAAVILLTGGVIIFVKTSRTKFEAADGSGDLNKKRPQKVDETGMSNIPEVGGADLNGLNAVKKDESTNINVISVNETNVAQVMQDTQVHNVQLNSVSSATNNVVMTQKTAAMPKIVTGTADVIAENDYQGDIFEERDAQGNFLRYVDAQGNTIQYVDEHGNQINPDL